MIVMDNKNLVNGSTALAPSYKPYNPNTNEEFEKLRRAKEEKKKAIAEQKLKLKLKVLVGILLAFSLGVVLILRYSAVYNLQKQLSVTNSQIHNVSMDNENLKVQIIKASNMQKVEQVATTQLHMITPDKNSIIYLQNTKDYFAKSTNDTTKNTKDSIVGKIKNLLF